MKRGALGVLLVGCAPAVADSQASTTTSTSTGTSTSTSATTAMLDDTASFVPGTWESTDPYVGPRDAALRDIDEHSFDDPIAGVDILEPLDPELPVDPSQHFVATFAIDGGGWTISGNVDAPYCVAAESPACPCESISPSLRPGPRAVRSPARTAGTSTCSAR